jgi:hypothetical protein
MIEAERLVPEEIRRGLCRCVEFFCRNGEPRRGEKQDGEQREDQTPVELEFASAMRWWLDAGRAGACHGSGTLSIIGLEQALGAWRELITK